MAAKDSSGDWRSNLTPESRRLIANKILESLSKHLPLHFRGPESLNELRELAVRFEEKIYNLATNQTDYLRKISLKMLSMEVKAQQAGPITSGTPNDSAFNQNIANSGIQNEPVTLFHPNQHNKGQCIPANRSVNDCKSKSIPEDDSNIKRMKISEPVHVKVTADEPTFTCPNCKCALVSPFSTICGHIYCENCIKTSMKKQKKCPNCGRKLRGKNSIHRVFLSSLVD